MKTIFLILLAINIAAWLAAIGLTIQKSQAELQATIEGGEACLKTVKDADDRHAAVIKAYDDLDRDTGGLVR